MFVETKCEGEVPAQLREPRREFFAKAADLLEQRGHAKLILQDKEGHVCIMGCMMVVGYGRVLPAVHGQRCLLDWHVRELTRHLKLGGWTADDRWRRLVAWNNAPERTQGEVVAALRAVSNI